MRKFAALVAIAAAVGSCDRIPGTHEYDDRMQRLADAASARTQARYIASAEELAARELKDPSSAQFRSLKLQSAGGNGGKETGRALCGELNAKNAMGAYVGYRRFIAVPKLSTSEVAPDWPSETDWRNDVQLCKSEIEAGLKFSNISSCNELEEIQDERRAYLKFIEDWKQFCGG